MLHILAERSVGDGDHVWNVKEVDSSQTPGAKRDTCLVCEHDMVVRRRWSYPANWIDLPDAAVLLLCE